MGWPYKCHAILLPSMTVSKHPSKLQQVWGSHQWTKLLIADGHPCVKDPKDFVAILMWLYQVSQEEIFDLECPFEVVWGTTISKVFALVHTRLPGVSLHLTLPPPLLIDRPWIALHLPGWLPTLSCFSLQPWTSPSKLNPVWMSHHFPVRLWSSLCLLTASPCLTPDVILPLSSATDITLPPASV